jgi:two-component system chemotaxis response regulator CheB
MHEATEIFRRGAQWSMTASPDPGFVIVIGASAGGVGALLHLSECLPKFFSAPICVVQHVGRQPSLLPELLRARGPNHAMHAEDGQRLMPGTLYVAPPDHHMMIQGNTLRLSRGPKENYARPAIDPLFRTAAVDWGPRAIGVVLTGQMDDGSSGLKSIKECGGIAIVQDPDTAAEPAMPRNALANVQVDYIVRLEELAPLLVQLVGEPARVAPASVPEELIREAELNRRGMKMEDLAVIATPSTLTCPDCSGTLWELKDRKPLRYRCHTGHAYSSINLLQAQKETAEHALWSGVRALQEREMLLRRLAGIANATGDRPQAAAGLAEADRLRGRIRMLTEMAETSPTAEEDEPDA